MVAMIIYQKRLEVQVIVKLGVLAHGLKEHIWLVEI